MVDKVGAMEFLVEDEDTDRLDRMISVRLGLSRTRVVALIEAGMVTVDGQPARKSEIVSPGGRVQVTIPEPVEMEAVPESIPLNIVWQDKDVAVIDKQPGLVVHPAPGHPRGTLVNALLYHIGDLSGIGGTLRPGIVHRLDRDTSGLLVVAKNDHAHRRLSEDLRDRTVKRLYQALSWGHFPDSSVTIDQPIGRDRANRKRMAVVDGGRPAVTRLDVEESWPAAELLEVSLETGRTHQIRVHLTHLGHPVVGDQVYGANWERGMGGPARIWARELARRVPRIFLHAKALEFSHPRTGERMRFDAELPPDLAAVMEWVRTDEP